ncbi:ATP-binding protein [Streptomyces alfalfae]|uniref:ATP-binding protein n=1 Tax=Streptomyces alfalfae TaxID=1642299 RepID=A0A7T4PGX3_9ACTN|nr:ATP-binding protein [Streptomyces alfalfae]QQC89743.1 ATP-binding protein [Streptomyces alfalfae]
MSGAFDGVTGSGMAEPCTVGPEQLQLGLARRLLGRARQALEGAGATRCDMEPLASQLASALGDTLLIAERQTGRSPGPPPTLGDAAPRTAPESLSVRRLPGAEPASAPAARHFVRNAARAWEVPRDLVETLEVITSELVTNALVHGGGETVTVALALTGRVRADPRRHGRGARPGGGGGRAP